jgi:DNA mismatch repair protein MutS2
MMKELFEKLDFIKIQNKIKEYSTTNLGKEKVDAMTFSNNIEKINYQLDITGEFKTILELDEPFPIDGIKDIRESLARVSITNAFLQPKDFLSVLSVVKTCRNVKNYLNNRKDKYPLLYELSTSLFFDKLLERNIEQVVDENEYIKDSASRTLNNIRQRIKYLTEQLSNQLERILKRYAEKNYIQDELVTQRDGRLVIPIKVEHKRHIPGFIHSASASGLTVFIEPAETLELNNEIRSLEFEEKREIERILKELTDYIRVHLGELKVSIGILSTIDFTYAKARYAVEFNGVKPVIKPNGYLKIDTGYHPVLLLKHKKNEIIPLNFSIGDKFQTLVITGPNAGGKSVALKTIGLLNLMLHTGVMIPVSPDSEFRILGRIFIDIGDEQSIENDLSTFSSHLLNLKEILENADSESLILIDEIGEGTDPLEGGAIAASVLTDLTNKKAFTVATTHQSFLKVFAHQSEGMENGAMEFDQNTIMPTYRYREGLPGSSYAIQIAIRLGINNSIIEQAKSFLGKESNDLEIIISDLEKKLSEYKHKIIDIDKQKLLYSERLQKLEIEKKNLEREKKHIKNLALKEAETIIGDMNSRIENVIKELREKEAKENSIKIAKSESEVIRNDFYKLFSELKIDQEKTEDFKKGNKVKIQNGSESGVIESVDEINKTAKINFGHITLDLPIDEIEYAKDDAISPTYQKSNISEFIESKEIKLKIDLRGKYGAEAIPLVDKFIDDAYIKGLEQVEIIHGKGSGALRQKISEFLKNNGYVQSFRLGEWNEGGSGVTIVQINQKN